MVETFSRADIDRIRFVTRRFYELQGLGTALLGSGLVGIVVSGHALAPGSMYQRYPFQALAFGSYVFTFAAGPIARMYRQNFGDPVAPKRRKAMAGLIGMLVLFGGLIDMTFQFNAKADGPSVSAVILASYALWIAARDWRWRIHYLVAAAAGLMGALVTAGVPAIPEALPTLAPARGEAFLLCYTLIGMGLVVAGFFDHRLLARSLEHPATRAADSPARALVRASNGLSRAAVGASFCLAFGVPLVAMDHSVLVHVLPLMLIPAMLGSQVAVAILQVGPAWRHSARVLTSVLPQGQPPVEPPAPHIGIDSLGLLCGVTLAGAVDAWVLPNGAPLLVAFAVAFASAWVAVRDWRYRPFYLTGAVAAVAALFAGRAMPPAQAFAVLVVAVSGSLVFEGLLDYRVFIADDR